MTRSHAVLMPVLALAVASSCADRSTAPTAEVTALVAALASPHADDGAVLVTLRGPDVTSIESASPAYLVYTRSATPQETRVLIVGDIVAGPLITASLGAGHPVSAYSASVEQVATRADQLRAPLAGYHVSVAAAP